ncbi:MAG: KGG domain-containing protein [Patescibacteria group bacterium]
MANDDNQGRMTVEEAGRKGGEATSRSHDRDFYQKIGQKGGKSQGKDNNPGNFANRSEQDVEDTARKGGES